MNINMADRMYSTSLSKVWILAGNITASVVKVWTNRMIFTMHHFAFSSSTHPAECMYLAEGKDFVF